MNFSDYCKRSGISRRSLGRRIDELQALTDNPLYITKGRSNFLTDEAIDLLDNYDDSDGSRTLALDKAPKLIEESNESTAITASYNSELNAESTETVSLGLDDSPTPEGGLQDSISLTTVEAIVDGRIEAINESNHNDVKQSSYQATKNQILARRIQQAQNDAALRSKAANEALKQITGGVSGLNTTSLLDSALSYFQPPKKK